MAEASTCALCGQPIDPNATGDDALSMDHVPPKQFFPKSIRITNNPNLWKVPTHKRCNNEYKLDEEYFFHTLCPLVHNTHSTTTDELLKELQRRASHSLTSGLIRKLLGSMKTVSPGGLALPPGTFYFQVDQARIQRVAIKIAQGVLYLDHGTHMPRAACKDIRLCETPQDAPEMYQLSWQVAAPVSLISTVFAYHHAAIETRHFVSMLFWEGFMFCMVFDEPQQS